MGRPKAEFTLDLVKEVVAYDPESGVFTWLKPAARVKVGDVVGSLDAHGYLVTKIRGNNVKLHRLAWFYMTGELPREIDHINRIKTDNRFANLRAVTDGSLQNQNKGLQKNNKTGIRGVQFKRSRKIYIAKLRVHRKQVFYGEFATLDDAVAARIAAEAKYHQFSPMHYSRGA